MLGEMKTANGLMKLHVLKKTNKRKKEELIRTHRHNTVFEGETNRHNSVAELLKAQSNTETGRYNAKSEKLIERQDLTRQ
jgi:hypothetical protein